MPPAHQRLKPRKAPGCQVHDGLIGQQNFPTLKRPAQAAFRFNLVIRRTHVGAELQHRVTLPLGKAQGQVSFPQQGLPALVVRFADGEADACRGEDFAPANLKRLRDCLLHQAGNVGGAGLVGPAGHQHGKGIAINAGQGVFRRDKRAQALGQRLQQRVSRVMAETFIHLLEAVDVGQHQRDALMGVLGAQAGAVQAVHEERPVGETRERIMQRFAHEARLRLMALGDVGDGANDAAGEPVLTGKAGGAQLQPAAALHRVGMLQPHLEAEIGVAQFHMLVQHLGHMPPVIAMDAGHPGLEAAAEAARHEAQMRFQRRVHIEHAGVHIEVPHGFARPGQGQRAALLGANGVGIRQLEFRCFHVRGGMGRGHLPCRACMVPCSAGDHPGGRGHGLAGGEARGVEGGWSCQRVGGDENAQHRKRVDDHLDCGRAGHQALGRKGCEDGGECNECPAGA